MRQRIPLRPLARILNARAAGANPALIENENRARRHDEMQFQARRDAARRLLALCWIFVVAFAVVGGRIGVLALSEPAEPRTAAPGAGISALRADIVDRSGRLLATNFETHALYAQPPQMIDAERAANELARIFPKLDAARLSKKFTSKRKFLWVKRRISPEQMQAVHDIGEPGLLFAPREMRLYPNGTLASHLLGGAGFGLEGVQAAEIIGLAGVEKSMDARLRDPGLAGQPLALSLDLPVQAAAETVLAGGMKLMNAKGASSILMDVQTGEIISLVSLPNFDPNNRPAHLAGGDPSDSPLFNRAVQGVYELGSVLKIFTAAQAVDLGLFAPHDKIDTSPPMKVAGHSIGEFQDKNFGVLSLSDVIVHSSNRGTGRLALKIGPERQRAFLRDLGFFDASAIELFEARSVTSLVPKEWTNLSTVTISYGHGISASLLHLASAYAMIANGGYALTPTLLWRDPDQPFAAHPRQRVISAQAAQAAQHMLRKVVTDGTASFAQMQGYKIAGKTGTADKPDSSGNYHDDKVVTTFASIFPADDPRYVLIVMLDEPNETSGNAPRRSAGWTAVPVAAEMIRRIGPLLGVRPSFEAAGTDIALSIQN